MTAEKIENKVIEESKETENNESVKDGLSQMLRKRKPVKAKKRKMTMSDPKRHIKKLRDHTEDLNIQHEVTGPYKVTNRLISFTGTTKVKLLDRTYNNHMSQCIKKKELELFNDRVHRREQSVKVHSQKLILEGKINVKKEDKIYNHPVLRVNRTMKRLEQLNGKYEQSITDTHQMPAITLVDLFSEDSSGKIFKSYENHRRFSQTESTKEHKESLGDKKESVTKELERESERKEKVLTAKIDSVEGMEFGALDPVPQEDNAIRKASETSIPAVQHIPKIIEGVQHEANLNTGIENRKRSNASLFNETVSSSSLENLIHRLSIDLNEESLRKTSAIASASDSTDPNNGWWMQRLESNDINYAEMFKLADRILEVYKRKQKVADDFARKFSGPSSASRYVFHQKI